MRTILSYIRSYYQQMDAVVFYITTPVMAILIFLNYHFGIDNDITHHYDFLYSFTGRYLIYLTAFCIPWILYYLKGDRTYFRQQRFLLLLFFAPAIFALKTALNLPLPFSDDPGWNVYWNRVFYWPVLLLITLFLVYLMWKWNDKDQPFYGWKTKEMDWRPYWMMLLIMLPLIAAASTQKDFLSHYPKLQLISGVYASGEPAVWQKALFELSYGSDFITIETFFRGFLVLAFAKWAGKDAILPMACFYCTIHFGKPLGECISSYFGGLLLGIVVFNTRSIFGGLMVHLGIAWLMEIGGYIGNAWK